MRFHSILSALISATFLLSAPLSASAAPLKAVATIFPLGDLLKRVGGDIVEVEILLKPGQSPHTYEPSPGDMKWIERSDVVVMAGFELETWLDKLLKASSKKERLEMDLSKSVKNPISADPNDEAHEGHGHAHGAINPHYWLDPNIMADAAIFMGERLAVKFPAESKAILARANAVANELRALDSEISKRLSAPGIGKDFVAFHNAWPYFARRYGLRVAGVIETAPGREPSAQHIVRLINEIKRLKARAVMVEPQFSKRLGETLAKEAGVGTTVVDPIGGSPGNQSYFDLMRNNSVRFEKALRGK
ncbi:MAG: zinc ABC transporter substrate-binding protein [Nitrospinae bacterium]|nr:zinc ABC transporter substrate-binding protein [Nitrospinota bacterium]